MSPPAEPRSERVQVIFRDVPAAIGVSETFTPLTTSYPTFLSLLNALSGSVAHKLDGLPHRYVQGQGFTLSDGGWWYRFVKAGYDAGREAGAGESTPDQGPWTLLDCLYGYEKLVGELCLGCKWSGACIEAQHNLQKRRDEAGINHAQRAGTNSPPCQPASVRYHHGHDSASTEPYYTVQDRSQQNSEWSDNMSLVRDGLQSGYDQRSTRQDFQEREGGGHHESHAAVDGGPGPCVDESNSVGTLSIGYNPPLIVTSPALGIIPPDDDEGDLVTPQPTPSTPVALSASNVHEPTLSQQSTERVKGPAGITYLPAYGTKAAGPLSDTNVRSASLSGAPSDPKPKFYPPPPGATGSPNDKYRQVPRSGGAIRNPNHQPYQYQYGSPDHQRGGEAFWPSAYNRQLQCPVLQQNMDEPDDNSNSPAGAFNQSSTFSSHTQRLGPHQYEQKSYPPGSSKGRARGKYDVRKVRGGRDKNTDPHRYSNRNQHRHSSLSNDADNPSRFPLDPALEVNYRNYNRQNKSNGGRAQHPYQDDAQSQYRNLNQYAGAPHFGDNAGHGNEDTYQYTYPAPPALNFTPIYYAPSAFAAQEQGMTPPVSPEAGMTAPTPMVVPVAHEQLRQAFVPSPLAAPFTPRLTNVRQEYGEQVRAPGQDQGQHYGVGGGFGAFGAFGPFGPFQHQLQGYGMLRLAPGSVAKAMPLSLPAGANLISQAPLLSGYERPQPAFSMPPMGEFSPPKARRKGKLAKKILEKVLMGTAVDSASVVDDVAASSVHDDTEHVVGDVDADAEERDDGDGEYVPQNEGRKKKYKKPQNPKNKRMSRLGLGAEAEDGAEAGAAGEGSNGESDSRGETGAAATATGTAESGAPAEVGEDEGMAEG